MSWSVDVAAMAAATTPAVSFGLFLGQIFTSWVRPLAATKESTSFSAMLVFSHLDLST